MIDIYPSALFLSPPVLLGRQMKPFSLAHSLLLEYAENPIVCGGLVGRAHLLSALYVCSFDFPFEFLKNSGEKIEQECQKWGEKIGEFDVEKMMECFRKYIKAFFEFPRRYDPIKKKEYAVPWQYQAAYALMRYCRMTELEAWNCPVARAACYCATISEVQGDDSLMTEEEIRGLEILKQDKEKEKK